MTINYTIILPVGNEVKLSAPYRHHHCLKLMTNNQKSHQALWMQVAKVFKALTTVTLFAVQEGGDACSSIHCLFRIYHTASTLFSEKYCPSCEVRERISSSVGGI